MREEIKKKIEDELGILIVDLKQRKQEILNIIEKHMDYIWKKKKEFEEMIKRMKEGLSKEEQEELSLLVEDVIRIFNREWDYWYNAYKIAKHEWKTDG
jgi:flagellar motility protein MotE (MotC chaperone)